MPSPDAPPRHLRARLAALLFVGLSACDDTRPAAGSPLAALEQPAQTQYEATVVACLPAGDYSYLELALADGERRWAVISSERPAVGAAVRTRVFGTRTHFDSRRLKRSFDRLDFAAIEPI